MRVPPAWRASCFCGHQNKAWARHNIFLPLYYSYDVIFMLTDFHLVLIIQQTFSKCLWCARHHSREGSYCCYCVFERTWSYIVYFQRPSFAVGDPQTCGQETLCSSLNASQMGSHHCHVPVPASEAEGTDMAERCFLTLGRHGVGTPLATFSRLAPAVWGWPLSFRMSGTTEGNETPSRDP